VVFNGPGKGALPFFGPLPKATGTSGRFQEGIVSSVPGLWAKDWRLT